MRKVICGIYDVKAQCYDVDPFFASNNAVAVRMFATGANEPKSMLARFPDDMILHVLGELDTETGLLVSYEKPVILGSAAQFVVSADPQQLSMVDDLVGRRKAL